MPAMIENIFPLLVLAVFVGIVGVIACAEWSSRKQLERARQVLAEMACPNCKCPFGEMAVTNAEAAWKAHVAELWKNNPGVRLRIVCLWFVTCSKCGWKGDFSPDSFELAAATDRHNKN